MTRNSRQAGIWRTVTRTGVLACLLLGACNEPDASPQAVAGKDGTASGANKEQSVTANTTPARTQPEQEAAPKQHSPNRLAKETSPYLLMHAHNPVDWYPWGEEAFAKAKKENKVIFLSIGYSSCHWCHVMEKESFMNEEIAKFINEHFVCIKVDREERPDVDEIYMTSLTTYNQLTTGRAGGGWPLSMFMTPEGKPFVGGSYFPPQSDPVRGTGFLQLVQTIQEYWTKDEKTLREQADQLTEIVKEQLDRAPADVLNPLTPSIPLEVHESLAFNFDAEYGGFNFSPVNPRIPKFPEPSNLLFLLDEIARGSAAGASEEDAQRVDEARKLLLVTLDKMAAGGIYDHLGGGFHRYSVDRFWRVPHFEKMLYDNGQLASVYAEAYKLTGDERYRRVVEETLAFVQRELTAPEGAFYSALDADSEGEEGTFYVWTREQIEAQLNGPDAEPFLEVFGITGQPNFEEKQYVLQLVAPLAETAAAKNMTAEELLAKLEPLKQTLFTARAERERPFTDTKILTSWNGLMIRGFADAGRLLEKPEYVDSARRAAEFLLANVRTEDGRLLRTYTAGEAKLNAYLDDYAFLTEGLIALHKATGEDRWLNEALVLTAKQIELFADANRGGFFFTSEDHEALIARTKGAADNVRPGGNSVSASNLLYLADHANKPDYVDRTLQTLEANSRMLSIAPAALPRMAILVRELSARGLIKPPAPPAEAGAGDNEPPLVAPPAGGAGQAAG